MTDQTKEIQAQIDSNKIFIFHKGDYLLSSLFFHSDMDIYFEEGVRLFLSDREEDFTTIPTRIAGIEMDGYPALLNFIDCENVHVTGKAILYGQGKRWYEKYWGSDKKGGMRKEYDHKGLRWACDYDCFRPKMILVQNSNNIHIRDLELHDSPFWNIHILYSKEIHLSNLTILSEDLNSPSTDGIDIDSSEAVYISSCYISTNDDGISIKSGRDCDGLKIHRPSKNIHIDSCSFRYGYGLSIGSELSGGIEDIYASHLTFEDSSCGFRIKSSKSRKGYVKNVFLEHLTMKKVKYPFYCYLDWNPLYNKNELPKDYSSHIPSYWYKLLESPSDGIKNTFIDNIHVSDVRLDCASCDSCLFTFYGFEDSFIQNLCFKNIYGTIDEYGTFQNCEKPIIETYDVKILRENQIKPGEFDNR